MYRILKIVVAIVLIASCVAIGQEYEQFLDDKYVELLRSEVRTQKIGLITDMMELTEEEASIFWPLYREYANELSKIYDNRLKVIREITENFSSFTDEKAEELAEKSIKIEKAKTKLMADYYRKMAKALSPTLSVKFFQIERWVNSMIELQISSKLPFIQ